MWDLSKSKLDPKYLRQHKYNPCSLVILGDWSDRDQKWLQVEEKVKRAMGQNTLDDGEFWMEFFSDFCREFEEVSICTLGPDFNHDGIVDASQVRMPLLSLESNKKNILPEKGAIHNLQ